MTKKTKKICSACGTSPVNHHLLYTLSFMEETVGVVGDKLFSFISVDKLRKPTDLIEKFLFTILSSIGIVHFNQDIEKALTGRSKLIWQEARERSIPMEQVVILGKPIELYRAPINGELRYFNSLPIPPWFNQSGYKWLDNKFILYEKLLQHSIPAPGTRKISTWNSALRAFRELHKPVILKPKNGSRGRHTTTNINSEKDLLLAFNLAHEITTQMVMQEHLFGSVYRATVINGELVGFFRADSPQINGDGLKTIGELIEIKNNTRPKRLSAIEINSDLVDFIKRQNYTLDSILPKDLVLNLSAKTGRMYGGYTKEMLPDVHPKMHQLFKKAGELVEAPVVGFDLIIEDPTKDPDKQKHWGIIECNSLPFIDLHNFALEGTPINLAKNVWDLWKDKK